MDTERKRLNYIVACVDLFAEKKQMQLSDAYSLLYSNDAIAFLEECYDAEHTLSFDEVLEDLEHLCGERKNS